MIIKYKSIFFLIFLLILISCNTEPLRNPVNVEESKDFNFDDFRKSAIAVLPAATGDEQYIKTTNEVYTAILKEKFETWKIISPDKTLEFINKNKLNKKLDKVYAVFGDEEDNVLFAAAIGIDLKAKYTVVAKISNIIFYGKKITDLVKISQYSEKYKATEEIYKVRTRYYKKTIAMGYLKIIDNTKHRIVWQVPKFKTEIRKLSGFISIPLEDVINKTYGKDYYKVKAYSKSHPSASRIIYRFFDRILSKW